MFRSLVTNLEYLRINDDVFIKLNKHLQAIPVNGKPRRYNTHFLFNSAGLLNFDVLEYLNPNNFYDPKAFRLGTTSVNASSYIQTRHIANSYNQVIAGLHNYIANPDSKEIINTLLASDIFKQHIIGLNLNEEETFAKVQGEYVQAIQLINDILDSAKLSCDPNDIAMINSMQSHLADFLNDFSLCIKKAIHAHFVNSKTDVQPIESPRLKEKQSIQLTKEEEEENKRFLEKLKEENERKREVEIKKRRREHIEDLINRSQFHHDYLWKNTCKLSDAANLLLALQSPSKIYEHGEIEVYPSPLVKTNNTYTLNPALDISEEHRQTLRILIFVTELHKLQPLTSHLETLLSVLARLSEDSNLDITKRNEELSQLFARIFDAFADMSKTLEIILNNSQISKEAFNQLMKDKRIQPFTSFSPEFLSVIAGVYNKILQSNQHNNPHVVSGIKLCMILTNFSENNLKDINTKVDKMFLTYRRATKHKFLQSYRDLATTLFSAAYLSVDYFNDQFPKLSDGVDVRIFQEFAVECSAKSSPTLQYNKNPLHNLDRLCRSNKVHIHFESLLREYRDTFITKTAKLFCDNLQPLFQVDAANIESIDKCILAFVKASTTILKELANYPEPTKSALLIEIEKQLQISNDGKFLQGIISSVVDMRANDAIDKIYVKELVEASKLINQLSPSSAVSDNSSFLQNEKHKIAEKKQRLLSRAKFILEECRPTTLRKTEYSLLEPLEKITDRFSTNEGENSPIKKLGDGLKDKSKNAYEKKIGFISEFNRQKAQWKDSKSDRFANFFKMVGELLFGWVYQSANPARLYSNNHAFRSKVKKAIARATPERGLMGR